jgi:tetratricopeptide (TPR) repeat protein
MFVSKSIPPSALLRLLSLFKFARARSLSFCLAGAFGVAAFGANQAMADGVPAPKASVEAEYWRGTITILSHDGTACAETSAAQALPYRKTMLLELRALGDGRQEGFAWGDMIPTRLGRLGVSAASRPSGPPDVVVARPANVLSLAWLPTLGPATPGQLGAGSGFVFKKEREILTGRWRERIVADQAQGDQCQWSEATVLLERANPAQSIELALEAQALQESFDLIERQGSLPAEERWSLSAIEHLLRVQQSLGSKGYGARALLPVLSKLAEQLVLNQSANKASPLLAQILIYLDGLLDQGPIEYSAYVTHLTPLLRMAGMLQAAEQMNRQSISLLMAQGHGNSPELARLLSGYGALLLRLKVPAQALQVYEQALAIERVVKEGKHIGVVIGLVNLSRVCQTLGMSARAKLLAQEASALHEGLGLGPLKLEASGGDYGSKV